MKNKRQFILAATLLALFSSPLLYAFEDCGTSVTECKLRQTIKALQERIVQLEKEIKTLRQEPTSGFFQDRLKDGSLGPKMVWIPAGTFRMGDIQGGGGSDEKPVHRVSVSRFAMGVYEVTVGEFRQFVNATGYKTEAEKGDGCYTFNNGGLWNKVRNANWRNPNFSQNDNHPVVCVSWNDATAYAKWLSQQTGKEYRLPSEAEWEYAARAGTTTKYWWGNTASHEYANYGTDNCCSGLAKGKDRWKYTAPVGSFEPNPFGIYDTVGNVWEWCADSWHGSYKGAPTDGQVWRGGDENRRVLRGGSWNYTPGYARTANRNWNDSDVRIDNLGFRVVSSVARTFSPLP